MSAAILNRDITLACADGRRLSATMTEPAHQTPQQVVQINSALGVPRRFYQRLAQFLATRGCAVLTYDYRGVGDSQTTPLRHDRAQFRDWGELDIAAAIEFVQTEYHGLRHVGIGHSAGGALLGLAHNCAQLSAFLSVASPSAYWRLWSFPHNLYLLPFWHLLIPTLPRLLGYFPGDVLGMGKLPKGVVLQWRRWAMHADYIVDESGAPLREHYQKLKAPMRFVHFSDDQLYAPAASVAHLASFYQQAPREIIQYHPEQAQQKSLGHFGYFRSSAEPLWQQDMGWLLQTPN